MLVKMKQTDKQPRRKTKTNQQLGTTNRSELHKRMVTGKQGRKLRDSFGRKELKFPTDEGSIIILYEGQTLMNTYRCLLSTLTMKFTV